MKKFALGVLLLASSMAYADRSVDEIYPNTCGVCHGAGIAGAPTAHDTALWQPRFEAKGMDGLLGSVDNGLNAMPAKGMCNDCTDTEYKELIEFMMKAS